ncbi:MAG: C40 family peptidase [Acidimicrobiia bacterium]|nr:C40 family peptidase [Acidimicrobiia bacterium]
MKSFRRGRGAVALAVVLALLLLTPAVRAQPTDDFAEARRRLEALQEESDALVDHYNEVAEEADTVAAAIADSSARVEQLREYVADNEANVRRHAVDTYKYGSRTLVEVDTFTRSGDFNSFTRAMKYLETVQGNSVDALRRLDESHAALARMVDRLADQEVAQKRLLADLASRRTQVEAAIAAQEVIVDQFRTELERQAAQDASAAQQLIDAGLVPVATTEQARGAIEWARARLGTPYCWGGVGPSCYDCSGLIQKAYASVGVLIPRTSYQMKDALLPTANPQPGDIGWHPGHVGLYIGAGYTIEAPRTGDVVRYRPVEDRYDVYLRPASVMPAPAAGSPAGGSE